MAFGGRKSELVATIGCGMNGLDSAKLKSNVTWIRDKIPCVFEQEQIKNEWLSHQLAIRSSWHIEFLLSQTRVDHDARLLVKSSTGLPTNALSLLLFNSPTDYCSIR